ncbi:MAG: hypothetical protein AAGI66_03475 [Cyanobacteria bacterium P01_H01_bin.74]
MFIHPVYASDTNHAQSQEAGDSQFSSLQARDELLSIKPLTAGIKVTRFLPGEMYGQWNVKGELIETNAKSGVFPLRTQNIWQLSRTKEAVIISNPVSGASATIHVDEVRGKTAVFHRLSHPAKHVFLTEIPTITVSGDKMTGQTVNAVRVVKKGKVKQKNYAMYKLEAVRIGQASSVFKPEDAFKPAPNAFEVLPIQYKINQQK